MNTKKEKKELIKIFENELISRDNNNFFRKIIVHEFAFQIDLHLVSNNLYFLFTNKEIGEVVKAILDFHAVLVVHCCFPEKKVFTYKNVGDHYFEYKFSNFIPNQRNVADIIPTQEIIFGSIN
ncbi:hypothetical protein OAK12_01730 [Alphaproteobacteria bacterium]|nr:hypothetical protein [Alphaproteobacteria bacterium]